MVLEESRPNISITALDDAVSIIHIPITPSSAPASSRSPGFPISPPSGGYGVEHHASDIFWTIERATQDSIEFFNVTSNCVEMAIFAQSELLEHVWGPALEGNKELRLSKSWRVFEVASGDCDDLESGNYAENITILYQSSYHADVLLVKESDFERASAVFASHDWTVNTTNNPSPRSSAAATPVWPLSPIPTHISGSPPASALEKQAIANGIAIARASRQLASATVRRPSPSPSPLEINLALLASPLAVVGFNPEASSNHIDKVQKYITWPERCVAARARAEMRSRSGSDPHRDASSTGHGNGNVNGRDASPMGSGGTSATRSRRRRSRLGLNGASASAGARRPFISYTRTQDGASLITDVEAIRYLFPNANNGEVLCGDEIGLAAESEAESETDCDDDDDRDFDDEGDATDVDEAVAPLEVSIAIGQTITDGRARDNDVRCERERDADDTPLAEEESIPWPGSPHFDDVKTPPPHPSYLARRQDHWGAGHQRSYSAPIPPAARPGMRTPTFHPTSGGGHHRWSVAEATLSPSGFGSGSGGSVEGRGKKRKGRKLCLQLDLSSVEGKEDGTYHLDKSGLVTQFSTALQKRNIRMLYSSTFHTANILVEARDVDAAQEVLRPSRARNIKLPS